MSDDSQRPIIVKKIKKGGHGHHGGAWKLAYADFVTAMMAFFLLMWLLGSTAKGEFSGIAEHFNTPLMVAMFGGSGAGDASSVVKGGGKDLTRVDGQVKKGEDDEKTKTYTLKSGKAEFLRKERLALEALKAKIESAIDAKPSLKQFKNQLLLDINSDGLRVQIVDEQNRPMFDTASAELKNYTRDILREMATLFNSVPNRISITGHTDAAQFAGGDRGFGNWELSSDRANAARRELVTGGMDEFKVLRVVGLSSTILFDRNDPFNPANRRISIVVLNKATEDAMLADKLPALDLPEEEASSAGELQAPIKATP
jgi:chemotaxis protein MotB